MAKKIRSLKSNINIKVSAATFCERIRKKIEDLMPCSVRYVSSNIIKIFVNV